MKRSRNALLAAAFGVTIALGTATAASAATATPATTATHAVAPRHAMEPIPAQLCIAGGGWVDWSNGYLGLCIGGDFDGWLVFGDNG